MSSPTVPRSGSAAVSDLIGWLLRRVGTFFLDGLATMGGTTSYRQPWPRCSIETRGYLVTDDRRHRRRIMTFAYDAADPWVIWIEIGPIIGGTGWFVKRDQLAAAAARAVGGGPLAVPVLTRRGEPPRELTLLLPSREHLTEFLGRSYDLVPDGSERRALALWIDQFTHGA